VSTRVGICRALHAFEYIGLWQAFIENLGFEVAVSEPTDRSTIEAGSRLGPAELCLPAKVFLGHALQLTGHVDLLFIPRIVCRRIARDLFFGCPKAIGLPDMTAALIPSLPSVAELVIDERAHGEDEAFRTLARSLGVNSSAWKEALGKAKVCSGSPAFAYAPDIVKDNGTGPRSGKTLRIGVVGHSYLLHDKGLNLDLIGKLRATGAEPVVASTNRQGAVLCDKRAGFIPNWMFERELIGDAVHMVERVHVSGLLLVSSFACGTSAVTNEVIRRSVASVAPRLPVLTVFLDEHTAEAGLVTRLESFVDLVRIRGSRM